MSVQNEKPFWVSHFKIEEAMWDELIKEAMANQCTPLSIACEKGLINESELQQIEQSKSELPVLSPAFFDEEPKLELFADFDCAAFKKESVLPLSKWEGHTLFAKLLAEKTDFENQLKDAIFVLAPWSAMKKWFAIWEKQTTLKESPQGLNVTAPSEALAKIDFGEIKIEGKPTAPVTTPSTPVSVTPKVTPPPIPKPTPIPAAAPLLPPTPVAVPNKPKAMVSPPLPSLAVIHPYPTIALPDKVAPVVTTPKSQHSNAPAVPFDQIVEKIKQATDFDALCAVILGCWKNYFEKSMIFTYLNNKLTSVMWDGGWKITDPMKAISVSLASPSIFKVAIDSAHPYHGYIMTSAVNKSFFDETNAGQYPDHVTITSMTHEDKITAVILGACTKEASLRFNINQLESLTGTFNDHLKEINSAKPASNVKRAG